MVLNATFNDISAISWWSVLLVEETGGPGENHRPVASHCQILSHNAAWAFGHLLTILAMPLEQDNLLVLQNTIFQ